MKLNLLSISVASALLLVAGCSQQGGEVNSEVSVTPIQSKNKVISPLELEAKNKLKVLSKMMSEARERNIDVTREEAVKWFAEQFIKFANWDESHPKVIEKAFGYERYYADNKTELAESLPKFERTKVIQILNKAMDDLGKELRGEIKRRPVNKVDWQNTKVVGDLFYSNGKPIFLYDYFSKSVGQPLTNTDVYNDYLGALYHGGASLYEVDHDRAINSFLVKEDGSFDQQLLEKLTSIPDTNIGFLYYWLMGIPEWAEKLEPEIRKGRSLFTGFDIDNPLAREIWRKIILKTGELTKGKKVTELGFVLANEPHWYSEKGHWTHRFHEMNDISSYTLSKFQKWLKTQYKADIGALNLNWGTTYNKFDDININIPLDTGKKGQPIWYDWMRYNMDRSTEWFKFVQTTLHSVNPEANTHIKIMPRMFMDNTRSGGIDTEALTELTTMIGHDAKSLGSKNIRPGKSSPWLEKYSYDWGIVAMFHDFLESVAPHKINVNSESHFLSSGQWRDLDMRTSYVRSVYWLATLLGMDANMGWFWARDPDGSPEDRLEGDLNFFDPGLGGAYAGSVNMQPHVANEVTQVMYDLNSFSEEMVALRKQPRPIRLFYSETTAINIDDYMTNEYKLYESLFFEGFPLGFATKNIIEKQNNSQWDVLVVFHNNFVTDDEFKAVQSYLNKGGTVILDSKDALSFNEYGKKRTAKLVAGKGKLVVLNTTNITKIKQAALAEIKMQHMPAILVNEKNGSQNKTTMWRSVQQPDGSYLVNIMNLGKATAQLRLRHQNGSQLQVQNLITNNAMSTSFELAPEGVLLLKVQLN